MSWLSGQEPAGRASWPRRHDRISRDALMIRSGPGPDRRGRSSLRALRDSLAGAGRPGTVLSWLDNNKDSAVLRQLATGERPLTHAALDELPTARRCGTCARSSSPPRRCRPATNSWPGWKSGSPRASPGAPGPAERRLLHQYAVWHVVRWLCGRLADSTSPTASSSAPGGTSGPPSPCSTGSPFAG
jgi:hypothetical protein